MRLIALPDAYVALQVAPQSMPAGALVTLPLPLFDIVSAKDGRLKLAVTRAGLAILTAQGLVDPEQAPDQPMNCAPVVGVAVRLTVVPGAKLVLQFVVQEIPVGTLVTDPLPATLTLRVLAAAVTQVEA